MTNQDPIGDWHELVSVDDDEGATLVQRLRFVAETLDAEFGGLSRADAERLIFSAAHEVLSAASVVQFVPTFAERRARHILQAGDFVPGEDLPEPAAAAPPVLPPEPAPPPAAAPRATPATASRPPAGPRRPDAFYADEARRLLEKARDLRAATLEAMGPDRANGA